MNVNVDVDVLDVIGPAVGLALAVGVGSVGLGLLVAADEAVLNHRAGTDDALVGAVALGGYGVIVLALWFAVLALHALAAWL